MVQCAGSILWTVDGQTAGCRPRTWAAGRKSNGAPLHGDYAGDLLYQTLIQQGLARGEYLASPDDGLELVDCRITNAVRCLPPQNKPVGKEINACRPFLGEELRNLAELQVVVALGRIAHDSVVPVSYTHLRAHETR